MKIRELIDRPTPELAAALGEFEAAFTYPLGPGRSFSISHGDDYTCFYRSMGSARCFVAEQEGRVVGALSVAIRTIVAPDGSRVQAAYLGDVKIDVAARGSFIFFRLAQAADAWARPQVTAAYGVVMDGTPGDTRARSGRVGIPLFQPLGQVVVLRLTANGKLNGEAQDEGMIATGSEGEALHRQLSRGRYVVIGGNPVERSQIPPVWMIHPSKLACGRLEDTRRAKRLTGNDGNEMKSAHLACFAFRDPAAGAELIRGALARTARLGLPAMFVSVTQGDLISLQQAIGPIEQVVAPATVYGAGLGPGADWNISTSEI